MSEIQAPDPPMTRATLPHPKSSGLAAKVQSLRLEGGGGLAPSRPVLPWVLTAILAFTSCWLAYPRPTPGKQVPSQSEAATNSSSSTASATGGAAEPGPSKPGPAPSADRGPVVLESKGYIVPAHQILVSPKVSGMIERLFVEEGRRVQKGDVLAELELTDYAADLRRAQALLEAARQRSEELVNGNRPEEIAVASAELEESIAQRDQLRSAFQRTKRLRDSNMVPENDFEQADSSYRAMTSRVTRLQQSLELMRQGARRERRLIAEEEVRQAQADVAKAQWRLDNCRILAPISGTILKKNAEEGNIVNPIAFNGSFSVCEMADLSDLEVELSIQERDISRVFKQQQCIVKAQDAYPDRIYKGYVSRLMPIADRAKGAVPVRVKVKVPADEEGVYLKPEMSVLVSFLRADEREGRTKD